MGLGCNVEKIKIMSKVHFSIAFINSLTTLPQVQPMRSSEAVVDEGLKLRGFACDVAQHNIPSARHRSRLACITCRVP